MIHANARRTNDAVAVLDRPPAPPGGGADSAGGRGQHKTSRVTVLNVFGTRPEVIKLAPVIHELERHPTVFRSINVSTSQHTDLLKPFLDFFGIRIDHRLADKQPTGGLNELCARTIDGVDRVLLAEKPDVVLVQGDTTSALAGALAAKYRRIPVGHVEAGLRTPSIDSPFPEELNRRLITHLSKFHFAATRQNVDNLLREGVSPQAVVQTGNPVIDALHLVLDGWPASQRLRALVDELEGRRIIVLTTHRRENFGASMRGNLGALRAFAESRPDVTVVFPVHPNPEVRAAAEEMLGGASQVRMIAPLDYPDFLHLLSTAWLIVSDSGGVQEEAPSLGKALLVLRDDTERPEAVACGAARLIGGSRPDKLAAALDEIDADDRWLRSVKRIENPFGLGDSAARIVRALKRYLVTPVAAETPVHGEAVS